MAAKKTTTKAKSTKRTTKAKPVKVELSAAQARSLRAELRRVPKYGPLVLELEAAKDRVELKPR